MMTNDNDDDYWSLLIIISMMIGVDNYGDDKGDISDDD